MFICLILPSLATCAIFAQVAFSDNSPLLYISDVFDDNRSVSNKYVSN